MRRRGSVEFAEITHIARFNIKSTAEESLEDGELDRRGLRWDRNWMFVDAKTLVQLTQRGGGLEKMALIRSTITKDGLLATAPTEDEILVPFYTQGPRLIAKHHQNPNVTYEVIDEGDAAARIFSRFLDRDVRLTRMPEDIVRPVKGPQDVKDGAQLGLADAHPLTVLSEQSVHRIAKWLKAAKVLEEFDGSSLRGNIRVSADMEAFWEDWIESLFVTGTQGEINLVGPSSRCKIPTVIQAEGFAVPNVNRILGEHRSYRGQEWVGVRKAPVPGIYIAQNAHHNENVTRLFVGQRLAYAA